MRSLSRVLAGMVALGALLLGVAAPALAAETANSEFVIIRPDNVVDDDLYAGAIKVTVEGTIDGDLIAFAAEEVVINGTVTGSVYAVAPSVVVSGSVGGSLRVSGGALKLSGTVGGDVVAAVVNAEFGSSSLVGGDALVWTTRMSALGVIGEDLEGNMGSLELAGAVDGDVDVSVGRLTVAGNLSVGGDLGYRSEREATGLEKVSTGGTIVQKSTLPPNIRVRALGLFGRFLVVLFLTISAIAVAYAWPERTESAAQMVRTRPLRSFGLGALVIFSPLLVAGVGALVLAMAPSSAAFPLVGVMLPLMLALLGLVFAVSLVAGIPVVGWIGKTLIARLGLYGAVLAGSAITGVAWLLPVIGWVVPLVVLPLGLGAWFASWRVSQTQAG